ncbi:MAG: hypothetical protein HY875_08225 [Chloroflexi bacterium]|nr:hypothetical protein [Chloroflexota bacterium]
MPLLALCAGALVACGGAQPLREGPRVLSSSRSSLNAIEVRGYDFVFELSKPSAPAGIVEFRFMNSGAHPHELEIIRMDGKRYGPPVGAVEPIQATDSRLLRVDLAPGSYRLVCLVVTDVAGEAESHRALGMEYAFEVEG